MEDISIPNYKKRTFKERRLSTLDKVNTGVSVMAVVFLIFRKQFDYLNTKEAEKVITYIRNSVPSLGKESSLEEVSDYLHKLPRLEFSNLIKQLIVACQDGGTANSFVFPKHIHTAN